MSTLIISQQKVYHGGYDITGDLDSINLAITAETPANTKLGDTTRIVAPGGLLGASFAHTGFIEAGDSQYSDKIGHDLVGTAGNVVTVGVEAGAYGEVAYMLQGVQSSMDRGGTVGDMYKFSADVMPSSGRLVRGAIMVPKSTITATADGTGRQLGAVSATQRIYGALHVFSAAGTSPTLDVTVESDAGDTWAGAETTQLTFTQATAVTAEVKSAAGAITDDWWRVAYAIGGSDTPTFSFAVVLGIV